VTWRGPEAEKGPSRRNRRRLAIRALRDQGRYGPSLREVLPAFAGVTVVVCGVAAGVAEAYRALGPGVLVAALALLAVVTPAAVRHHRPLARRRLGHYTPEELAELDTDGLVLAVSRMLRRDGWMVLPPPTGQDRPRVRARNGQGQRVEVAFRPVAEPLPDEEPARPARQAGTSLRLVVHRGTFTRRDIQWARRQDNTHLIDGPRLRSWARGTPLHQLTNAS
jgi:hypothetical protein